MNLPFTPLSYLHDPIGFFLCDSLCKENGSEKKNREKKKEKEKRKEKREGERQKEVKTQERSGLELSSWSSG